MKRFRTLTGFAFAGSIALAALTGVAGAETYSPAASQAEIPAIATSTVTITAKGQSGEERATLLGMREAESGRAEAPAYSYVVYFPVGESTLTQPAMTMVSAVAEEVTEMELSTITVTPNDGLLDRAETVRNALVDMGVPARWIAIDEDGVAETDMGPVSSMGLQLPVMPASLR